MLVTQLTHKNVKTDAFSCQCTGPGESRAGGVGVVLRWKERSKLTTSAACYLALEVTVNMVFFKNTAKLFQLFLSAVQFFCKKIIFNRIRRIA